MDSAPSSISSRTAWRADASSSGLTTSPRALMRSRMPRVSSRSASGSGFCMMIQPASGPGVCERARCRTCSKFSVTRRPTLAPFSSSTMLVDTVVPCSSAAISEAAMPVSSISCWIPSRIPTDWSLGVDGVFNKRIAPERSSNRSRSVNVPPTSMPSRLLISSPALAAPERRRSRYQSLSASLPDGPRRPGTCRGAIDNALRA